VGTDQEVLPAGPQQVFSFFSSPLNENKREPSFPFFPVPVSPPVTDLLFLVQKGIEGIGLFFFLPPTFFLPPFFFCFSARDGESHVTTRGRKRDRALFSSFFFVQLMQDISPSSFYAEEYVQVVRMRWRTPTFPFLLSEAN